MESKELEYKQDGTLTKASIKMIEESGAARGGTRSFNEVTGETVVVTSWNGEVITYTEDGDTRDKSDEVESLDEGWIDTARAENVVDGSAITTNTTTTGSDV